MEEENSGLLLAEADKNAHKQPRPGRRIVARQIEWKGNLNIYFRYKAMK